MGETNCEKGGSYCFFRMTTPCAINNLSLLQKQPNVVKLNYNTICNHIFNG